MNISRKMTLVLAGLLMTVAFSMVASAYSDYNTAAGFLGLSIVMCVVSFVIPIVIGLLIGIWVYKDAEKRGKSGALWLIINILLPIIGLIIWLVIRPPIGGEKPAGSDRKCPNCGRAIPLDARTCPYCGKNFEQG